MHYSRVVDVNRSTARLRWRMHGAHGREPYRSGHTAKPFPERKTDSPSWSRTGACLPAVSGPRLLSDGPAAGPRALRLITACGRGGKSCFPRTCFVCSDLLSFRFCFILPPPYLGLRVRKANRASTRDQLSSAQPGRAHVPRCTSTDFTIAHCSTFSSSTVLN
jgi:hypothetical protein